ncbi:MAG: RNA 3'-terminal phosphate cyclase [Candidatus Diapherotrites archaeon]|nr:RNA 3'-terminal phosphate cyclase [Candidatus Diapherotrites archaeon]
MDEELLHISGAYGEGGGQILRTALSLSAILGRPIRITDIRARRPRPGLQPQHLTAVQALQKITRARVSGAVLDSQVLEFYSGPIRGGRYVFNIGTAGSVVLVAQTIILPLLFADAPSQVRIIGGTDVEHSPSVDYFAHVFLPWIARLGARVDFRLVRRGYYPKGGGEVDLVIHPLRRLNSLVLVNPPEIRLVRGISHAGALPEHVAERQADAARKRLESAGYSAEIDTVTYSRSHVLCPGSGVTLWADNYPIGASALGARGLLAEVVGKRAANYFIHTAESGAPVDAHMGDQLVPYLALARGYSEILVSEPTLHQVTNAWVVEQFLGKRVDFEREEGRRVRIKVHGVGHEVDHSQES